MHAHRCKVCASRGISTIWIHGDDEGGSKIAHKCPKCGAENWAKFMVEPGQLPQARLDRSREELRTVINVLTTSDALVLAFTYAALVLLSLVIIQSWDRIVAYFGKVSSK